MGFFLFLLAAILWIPLNIINISLVIFKKAKSRGFLKVMNGYFYELALDIDRFGNRSFRTLWNTVLIKRGGYSFGNVNETISSALGKNQRDNTLKTTGIILAEILDFIDKDHCKKSIDEGVN